MFHRPKQLLYLCIRVMPHLRLVLIISAGDSTSKINLSHPWAETAIIVTVETNSYLVCDASDCQKNASFFKSFKYEILFIIN